ncbi:MAG: hypothetical protein JWM87_3790 [Candidatus Eremiobacteraeota bacterium]|nr:hypothetical protein [Candidatus Eremiobacteraeota bacterium]
MRVDPTGNTFGLPPCLWLPIAAASIEAIAEYVGAVNDRIVGGDGRINALLVEPYEPAPVEDPRVALWHDSRAGFYRAQLHPARQVWVHVDYRRYRAAYLSFRMPPLAPEYVLDHVQNRHAIRLRGYSHPYLRLCPVSRAVNTSGGVDSGGEGMEKAYVRSLLASQPHEADGPLARFAERKIIYADPMDITKMLDIAPGTQVLNGVRDTMQLLYPRTERQ